MEAAVEADGVREPAFRAAPAFPTRDWGISNCRSPLQSEHRRVRQPPGPPELHSRSVRKTNSTLGKRLASESTPEKDKRHVVFESGHTPLMQGAIRETLDR